MSSGHVICSARTASLPEARFPDSPENTEADVFTHYEYVESSAGGAMPATLKVVVFNAMRGTHFDAIVERIRATEELSAPDLVLASELDIGMLRSGNRHIPMELAGELGMSYAFATEFVELSKGDEEERKLQGENAIGLHGNAIFSRYPLANICVVRLPSLYNWYESSQKRIGGRMAVVAEPVGSGMTVASVHLENFTDPEGRARQTEALLEAVSGRAVIAGDFNTSGSRNVTSDTLPEAVDPLDPVSSEPLFERFTESGFAFRDANPFRRATTPKGKKIDWAFVRGVEVEADSPAVVAATDIANPAKRISDHDFLSLRVHLPARTSEH